MSSSFRVHPAIAVARVGNSEQYFLAPETMAGRPSSDGRFTGGLPIKAGTEAEAVRSSDLRDEFGALKRQAARFRIYAYPEAVTEAWPTGAGTEVTIGTQIDGKTVANIVWSVHVANKKANTFVLVEDGNRQGIAGYEPGPLPPIRNPDINGYDPTQPADPLAVLNDPERVRQLSIDPGPRTASGKATAPVRFDAGTPASFCDPVSGKVVPLPDYPKSFPIDSFEGMTSAAGPIDSLGHMETDALGRLIVVGGYGRACGWKVDHQAPLSDNVNNNHWFDDTSDGPVNAVVCFDDGTQIAAAGAWVTTTDPSYAPQILNVVSLWDDVYDVWVRELRLAPTIFDFRRDEYLDSYQPSFDDDLRPIFAAASLQQWVTNLNPTGRSAHGQLVNITAETDPSSTPLSGLTILRNPNDSEQSSNTNLMPMHLGDADGSFLALRKTQYFFLERWNEGKGNYVAGPGPALGPGECLDKAVMVNCLGGRFSPGIDLTFVVRQPSLYIQDWETAGVGPFRIRAKLLAYERASRATPLLTGGYIPLRLDQDGLEPGDLSKWLAIPWHTDYNSCATHPPSPNPGGNRALFWSWPAQRPVAVYAAQDIVSQPNTSPSKPPKLELGTQRWSVRGPGTGSPDAENWGRFQPPIAQMLDHWHQIGTVMQGTAIDTDGTPLPDDWYLETQSLLEDTDSTPVVPFPNIASTVNPGASTVYPNDPTQLDERTIFYQQINNDLSPAALADARAFVDAWLAWSEQFSLDPSSPADQRYFAFTEEAYVDRLNLIYQELVDGADAYDPASDPVFKSYEDCVTRITQLAPFNLTDGAWLRNIDVTGPIDDVRALLYSISMDEAGDGDVSRNHCNIYLDLCHSVGYYPQPVQSREFAYDPQLLQSSFTVPAFELAISQFSEEYYPELLGMTVQLEWEVVELKGTRDLFDYFGVNSHFYEMHIGIDNAVNGHGQRAVEAVKVYLQNVESAGGQEAVQVAWRRIWNGFVAFGNIGGCGETLAQLITRKPSLRDQVVEMIKRKSQYGKLNHQTRTIGATPINAWFDRPAEFLDALLEHDYLTPGNWAGSRFNALLNFQGGPMFRVFEDTEISLWANYTQSLAGSTPDADPGVTRHQSPESAAEAMAAVIDELRDVQRGVPGHDTSMLADMAGTVHPMRWWFTQPTRDLMQALSSPINDVITLGSPEQSMYFTVLISPSGPMGSIFGLSANSSPERSRRQVVFEWISAGCPLPTAARTSPREVVAAHTSLRLTTPAPSLHRHATGKIFGMGTIH